MTEREYERETERNQNQNPAIMLMPGESNHVPKSLLDVTILIITRGLNMLPIKRIWLYMEGVY